jgi:predicted phosphodiesterase
VLTFGRKVHDQMVLPAADVLVHAGDVMTESLLRHVKDGTAKAKGEELFVQFAEWFCSRPHPHKVLIAGNHDGAMEAIGAKRIRESKHIVNVTLC